MTQHEWPHPYAEVQRDGTTVTAALMPGIGEGLRDVARLLAVGRKLGRCDCASLAMLHHAAIEPIHGRIVVTTNGCPGESADRLRAAGAIPIARVVGIVASVIEALRAAHAVGVLHRALSLASVVIDGDDVRVLDFGLGELLAPDSPHATLRLFALTPERIFGLPAAATEDVYLLGCIAYHLISGDPPLVDEDAARLRRRHAIEDPPLLSRTGPLAVPSVLARVIERCLAKESDDRFADMDTLAQAWAKAASDAGLDPATHATTPAPSVPKSSTDMRAAEVTTQATPPTSTVAQKPVVAPPSAAITPAAAITPTGAAPVRAVAPTPAATRPAAAPPAAALRSTTPTGPRTVVPPPPITTTAVPATSTRPPLPRATNPPRSPAARPEPVPATRTSCGPAASVVKPSTAAASPIAAPADPPVPLAAIPRSAAPVAPTAEPAPQPDAASPPAIPELGTSEPTTASLASASTAGSGNADASSPSGQGVELVPANPGPSAVTTPLSFVPAPRARRGALAAAAALAAVVALALVAMRGENTPTDDRTAAREPTPTQHAAPQPEPVEEPAIVAVAPQPIADPTSPTPPLEPALVAEPSATAVVVAAAPSAVPELPAAPEDDPAEPLAEVGADPTVVASDERLADLLRRANESRRAGRTNEGITLYRQALGLSPGNTEALAAIARIHFDRGAFADAVMWGKRVVDVTPSSARARLALGDAYFKLGKLAQAEAQYRKADKLGHRLAESRLAAVRSPP